MSTYAHLVGDLPGARVPRSAEPTSRRARRRYSFCGGLRSVLAIARVLTWGRHRESFGADLFPEHVRSTVDRGKTTRRGALGRVLAILAPRLGGQTDPLASVGQNLLAGAETLPRTRNVQDLAPTVEVRVLALVWTPFEMGDEPRTHHDLALRCPANDATVFALTDRKIAALTSLIGQSHAAHDSVTPGAVRTSTDVRLSTQSRSATLLAEGQRLEDHRAGRPSRPHRTREAVPDRLFGTVPVCFGWPRPRERLGSDHGRTRRGGQQTCNAHRAIRRHDPSDRLGGRTRREERSRRTNRAGARGLRRTAQPRDRRGTTLSNKDRDVRKISGGRRREAGVTRCEGESGGLIGLRLDARLAARMWVRVSRWAGVQRSTRRVVWDRRGRG
jgi:hypothetical protein